MRKKMCVVIAIILLVTTSLPKILVAESEVIEERIEELREKRKLAQEALSENTTRVDELEIQISDLMSEIQDLTDNIYKYEIDVAILDEEIKELDEKIEEVEAQLSEAEKRYIKQKDALNKRIVAMYEAGETCYLDVLLGSKDLVDFISRYYTIGEIAEIDNEILNSYKGQKEEVNKTKQILDQYKAELKQKKDEQESSAIVLSNIRKIKNSQMTNLSREEQQLQLQIDEYQREIREIEVELLIALTANLGSDYAGGELGWPIPGYYTITSNYGMRVHPIYGVYRMHTGTDIPASMGAFCVAANDGVVITSKLHSGYGNVVVVDHGGGLSTLYAHGSERLVEVGDTVKRGDPVLRVGSTGISTGPHLHFEVRINGVAVEATDYILNKKSITETINETEEEENNE